MERKVNDTDVFVCPGDGVTPGTLVVYVDADDYTMDGGENGYKGWEGIIDGILEIDGKPHIHVYWTQQIEDWWARDWRDEGWDAYSLEDPASYLLWGASKPDHQRDGWVARFRYASPPPLIDLTKPLVTRAGGQVFLMDHPQPKKDFSARVMCPDGKLRTIHYPPNGRFYPTHKTNLDLVNA